MYSFSPAHPSKTVYIVLNVTPRGGGGGKLSSYPKFDHQYLLIPITVATVHYFD